MVASVENGVFVHEKAIVESSDIGEGTRVWAFAHVMRGARVGAGCNICESVFVENGAVVGNRVTIKNGVQIWDGVTLEDEVFVGPNATFTNDPRPRVAFPIPPEQFLRTRVETGASVGANATVLPGVVIGRSAFVAAGSVVTRDVAPHAMVMGVPARWLAWVCACGTKLGPTGSCSPCGRAYDLNAFDRALTTTKVA